MSVPARPLTRFDELPRLGRVNLALLLAAVAALSVRMWPQWLHNPDLSHGLLMPLVFVLLIREARVGTTRFVRDSAATTLAFGLLLAAGSAALVVAGLYAASVDWSHPLVDLSLTAALMAFLTAGLAAYASDRVRFISVNWSAAMAILLWAFCTPIPPGTYNRLTVTLQLWVSEAVLQTLHLLGIAALRHGNIIELGQTTVGVEEACSGVRSLISCVFAGLFFSATLVRRRWARALIIALAAPLALVMNFLRSLTLTLLSNHGVDISGAWHDVTGFAVLGVTAAILATTAVALDRGGAIRPSRDVGLAPGRGWPMRRFIGLTATLAVAAALVFVSIANTRPSVRQDSPVPDLDALLPATAPGWQVTTSNDLYQFRDTLQTDHLAQRTYRKIGADGRVIELIIYAAYWRAGQAPVSLVASHTPDACWPGSGWTMQPAPQSRVNLMVDGRPIANAEYRLFTFNDFPQHVWFWHLYDGRPIAYRDPYSPIALLRIALKYGFRHDGDQLFIRISSNHVWSDLAEDPLLAEFFRRSRQLGL